MPPLSQMAVFFPMSIFFGGVAADPFSGFDAESFMTLTSLSRPDETLTIPILVGLITMANVESSTWFMTAAEKQAVAQREQRRKDAASKGVHHIAPANGIKQALRAVSVLRIVFAAQVSGVRVSFSAPLQLACSHAVVGHCIVLGYFFVVWSVPDLVHGVPSSTQTRSIPT